VAEQKGGSFRSRETALKSGKSFALYSENHDVFAGDHTYMSGASPFWMREKGSKIFLFQNATSQGATAKPG
jgi:hypothetical protein